MKSKFRTIPFESLLDADGAEFELRFGEYGQGYAATSDYRFRYSEDEVQISPRKTFDKWGNSAAFVCSPVPATREDYDSLLIALDKVRREKRTLPEFGSFDIWPFLRQARRNTRNATRRALAMAL